MAKILYGTVTSDKADKTIVISVRERRTHPLYKKQYTINTKFKAHDEKNEAQEGDKVTISETRPLSATKRFKLDKIVERGGVRFEENDATSDIPQEISEPKPEKPVKAEPSEATDQKEADNAMKPTNKEESK